jgi:hypothetical protein
MIDVEQDLILLMKNYYLNKDYHSFKALVEGMFFMITDSSGCYQIIDILTKNNKKEALMKIKQDQSFFNTIAYKMVLNLL